mmetsp:Transcript_143143/g.274995  ORF Transcript_143143/g.274995 Transcript_143143/m.274995 type:complete len:471 (-) Transcript_143143:47-1459(-)
MTDHDSARALNGSALGHEVRQPPMHLVTLDSNSLGSGFDANGQESNWQAEPLDGRAASAGEDSNMDWSTIVLLAVITFICISGLLVICCLFGNQQRWRKRSFVWIVDPSATVAMRIWVPPGGIVKVHPEFALPDHQVNEGGDTSPTDDNVVKPAESIESPPSPPKAPPPLLPQIHCARSSVAFHKTSQTDSGSRERAEDLESTSGSSRLPNLKSPLRRLQELSCSQHKITLEETRAQDASLLASRPTSVPETARKQRAVLSGSVAGSCAQQSGNMASQPTSASRPTSASSVARKSQPASSGLPAVQLNQGLRFGSLAEQCHQPLALRPTSAASAPSASSGSAAQLRGRATGSGIGGQRSGGNTASRPTSAASAPSACHGSAAQQRGRRARASSSGSRSCQAASSRPTSAPSPGASPQKRAPTDLEYGTTPRLLNHLHAPATRGRAAQGSWSPPRRRALSRASLSSPSLRM